MDKKMIAYCGSYCGVCEWKDKLGCQGCHASCGKPFWGECGIAKCCIEKAYAHCGECPAVPCQQLQAAFDDPEHGDDGVRLRNLLNWKAGLDTFERLHNAAQEQAKKL